MQSPLVSIIIPCYNDERFVEQAIISAVSQTYEPKEIIVVDDGSNANTKSILKKNRSIIDQLITQENKGLSAARNKGIEDSNGEFIIVLDSDDFFEPTYCQKAMDIIFSKDPQYKLITCQARRFDEKGTIDVFTPKGGTIENFLFRNAAIGNSLFKKSDWSKIGGYDESMTKGFEDWEFFIRLLTPGGEAYVIKEPLFNYRQKRNSMRKEANLIRFELWKYIFIKNKDLYQCNFEKVIEHFVNFHLQERKAQRKLEDSLEYKVGSFFLKPLRFMKSKMS